MKRLKRPIIYLKHGKWKFLANFTDEMYDDFDKILSKYEEQTPNCITEICTFFYKKYKAKFERHFDNVPLTYTEALEYIRDYQNYKVEVRAYKDRFPQADE